MSTTERAALEDLFVGMPMNTILGRVLIYIRNYQCHQITKVENLLQIKS